MSVAAAILENDSQQYLFPFTLIRSAADIRIGLFSLREKWELMYGHPVQVLPAGSIVPAGMHAIPANLVPIHPYHPGTDNLQEWIHAQPKADRPWQLAPLNRDAMLFDLSLIRSHRTSMPVPGHVRIHGQGEVFIEEGARLEHCILNTTDGPVYIGKNALIMDGAVLRGPVAVCEGATIKMGAMIYGGSTIGPYCVAGGEIKNSILMEYSNKAHEGYVGDAVIGSWCNIGAGTNCSNLQNSARPVKVWNAPKRAWETAGTKCGLMMGDFSRAAINTAFNTGTLTGICCNIFNDTALTPTYIPSFSWGVTDDKRYELTRALEDIRTWMGFKKQPLDPGLEAQLRKIYQLPF
jgi:UDP-N-acetylglucosamine diphosphorylase/glucosamine-1-phosphate N-acetyltransferase